MSLDSAIDRFRRRQQDLFRDEAKVTRVVGERSFNPATGTPTHTVTTVYQGACLARPRERGAPVDHEYGDTNVMLRLAEVKFPADTAIHYDDTVVLSVSTYDAGLVNVPMRVIDIARDGWQIARVCVCEEILR